MDGLDLSEVDPLKWVEVRRRAAAVNEYLGLANPTAADRERYAAMLDLGAHQFSNLVKTWLAHRDAVALAPGMRRARRSRSRRDGVDPRARVIARTVIADLGAATSLPVLIGEIARRCAADKIQPPSRGTVWLLAVEARGKGGAAPEAIVVARAHLRLPVDTGRGIVFPEVVVAAEVPTGRIVDIVMLRPLGDFDARRVAEAITTAGSASDLTIIARRGDVSALTRYLGPRQRFRIVSDGEAARTLSQALGKRIGLVEIAFRPPSVRPATVMSSGRDRPPSVKDAELVLLIARDRHNAELDLAA